MEGRKYPVSLAGPLQTDAAVAPADPGRKRSSVIYFCSAEEVSEGFAIALRAMGFDEILLSDLIPQSDTTSNPGER